MKTKSDPLEVFISWSGADSRSAGAAVADLLVRVFGRRVKPWFSPNDIAAGKRWSKELGAALERIDAGILCITRANRQSSWIAFEAGAIAKAVESSNVFPLLFDLTPSELDGPLSQFQASTASMGDVTRLVSRLNGLLAAPVREKVLSEDFRRAWPAMNRRIRELRARKNLPPPADVIRRLNELTDVVHELLRPVRSTSKRKLKAPRTTIPME